MKKFDSQQTQSLHVIGGKNTRVAQIGIFILKTVLDYGFSLWKQKREKKYAQYYEPDSTESEAPIFED